MGLSSFKFVQWALKDASFLHQRAPECVLAVQGHPRSMILVPIERSYLAPFLRYGDLLAKKCLFFLPLSHSAPSLPKFPLEFCGEVKHEETRVMGLSSVKTP